MPHPVQRPSDSPKSEHLDYARRIIRDEGETLLDLADRLDDRFLAAVGLIHACPGCVLVTGMGKAGLIGQKISATLASTGTRSHFIHPGEAFHGDLGRIHNDDAVLVLSQSGETEEIVRLLPPFRELGIAVIAITGNLDSTLAAASMCVIDLGRLDEACPLGLAPSTSTTAMLALGDALALVVSRIRGFAAEDFARFHPGGSLGFRLSVVDDHMRSLESCRVARETATVRDVLTTCSRPGRRTGAVMIVDENGRLAGIFTDSDLARLLETRRESTLDGPIGAVMTRNPAAVAIGAKMSAAMTILAERKISELPVLDEEGKPHGLIDITDLAAAIPGHVGLLPQLRLVG